MYLLRNPIVGPRLHPSRYYRTQEVMPRWEQFCALEFSNETHAREAAALDSRGGKSVRLFFDNQVIATYSNGTLNQPPAKQGSTNAIQE
jgi:hypothetical protein